MVDITIDSIINDAKKKMEGVIDSAKEDFASIRTGRANPALFNRLLVDYYGTKTPLQQLAAIQAPEPRVIVITPYDKTTTAAIEKAIRESDLGVNPNNETNLLRVVLPEMTQERRKDYTKIAKVKAEEAKVAVRGLRHKAKAEIDKLVKDKNSEVSEDDGKRAEKALDSATKGKTTDIDTLLSQKENELLSI
jgi:ribosome recycling factor